MTTVRNQKKEARYELEIEGAKAFLAPLTFAVAEASLGFKFRQFPKNISAGEIIVNSLFLHGSPKFKNSKPDSVFSVKAFLQASQILDLLSYRLHEDTIFVKNHKGIEFKFKLAQEIPRDALEDALGLLQPNSGNSMPLTAGKRILEACWLEGDEEIKQDDEMLICACLASYYRINKAESSLKKL